MRRCPASAPSPASTRRSMRGCRRRPPGMPCPPPGLAGSDCAGTDSTGSRTATPPAARRAIDAYAHRLRREIAARAAAMNGLDVLAFTGGIGEHQPEVRADAAAGLAFLGVAIDPVRNAGAQSGDADISASADGVRTLVIAAREDVEVARQAREALGMTEGPGT